VENDRLQHVEAGSILVITEGSVPVAYFHAAQVTAFA